MRIAVCPGSFDPITQGHLDIVRRAAKLFDKVIVVVVINPDKRPVFTAEERRNLIEKSVCFMENVEVATHKGLLVEYVKKVNACAIVKGLRAVSDFEYEFQMAMTNRKLMPTVETVFLNTSPNNMFLSSSLVKQVAKFGGDISEFVPRIVQEEIERRLLNNFDEKGR